MCILLGRLTEEKKEKVRSADAKGKAVVTLTWYKCGVSRRGGDGYRRNVGGGLASNVPLVV